MKNVLKKCLFCSIKTRLLTMTMGILIGVICLLTVIIAQNSANLLGRESRRHLSQSLYMGVEILNSFMLVREANLDLWCANPLVEFVANPVLGAVFVPSLREYFSEIKQKEPWIENIFLIKDNTVIYDDSESFEFSDGTNGSPDGLKNMLSLPENRFSVINLNTFHPDLHKDVIFFKHPLLKKGKPAEGCFLILLLDLEVINTSLFGNIRVGNKGFITIVAESRSGEFWLPWQSEFSTSEETDFVEAFGQWKCPTEIPDHYKSILLDNQKLPDYPLFVGGAVSLNDVKKPVRSLIFSSVFFGTLALLAGILSAFFFSERLTAPIRELTEKVRAFADSHLSEQKNISIQNGFDEETNIETYYEVEILTRNFDFMQDAIREKIAQLQEKQKKLEKAERKYHSIFENAIEGIFQSTPDGLFLSANPSMAEILGYDSDEELITSVTNIAEQCYVNPDDRRVFCEILHEKGRVIGFEVQYKRKDNTIIWGSLSSRCIRDSYGNALYYEGSFINITERRDAEQALKESEEIFRTMMEQLPISIEIYTPDGILRYANQENARLFGVPVEGMFGNYNVFDDVVVKQIGAIPHLEKVLAGETVHNFEATYDAAIGLEVETGRKRRLKSFFHPLKDINGHVRNFVIMHEDITELRNYQEHLENMVEKRTIELKTTNEKLKTEIIERIQAEDALRESERKLSDIIDFLPDATLVIDHEGKVIAWNKAIEKMTGVKAEDMLGKGNYEYAIPFYKERRPILIDLALMPDDNFEKKYPKIMRKKGVLTGEAFTPNLPGGNAYIFGTASALYDSKGNIDGAIELLRDITDRKKAEDELIQTKEYLENVLENSADGIGIVDIHGKIVSWNKAAKKLYGYTSAEIIGTSFSELYTTDKNGLEKMLSELRKNGFVKRYEITMRKKDGTDSPFELSIALLKDEDKKNIGSICVVRDLSEIKKALTETRIARETAEQANRKIMDSINYAKLIQRSLLANLGVVKSYLPNSFFIWEPRDIVGGDIFYTDVFEDGFIVAVIDCTGHGIPGAFMTMIASTALKRITKDEKCHDPAEILKRLNYIVKTTLQQDTEYAISDDGLDAGVCFVSQNSGARIQEPTANSQQLTPNTQQQPESHSPFLTFAGARLPLYYSLDNEVSVIRGDRQSIGYKRSDTNSDFTNHTIRIEKGMSFYMATDGFADQIGGNGERKRRFGTARLKNLLKDVSGEPFEIQRKILATAFEIHRAGYERQDDMTVIGFGF